MTINVQDKSVEVKGSVYMDEYIAPKREIHFTEPVEVDPDNIPDIYFHGFGQHTMGNLAPEAYLSGQFPDAEDNSTWMTA